MIREVNKITKADLLRFNAFKGFVVHFPDHEIGTKVFVGFEGHGTSDGTFEGVLKFANADGEEDKTCSWAELMEPPRPKPARPASRYRRTERTDD